LIERKGEALHNDFDQDGWNRKNGMIAIALPRSA